MDLAKPFDLKVILHTVVTLYSQVNTLEIQHHRFICDLVDSENEIDEEDENVSENDKEDETDEFCRNLIDEIRREQFGIGESFGEREAKLIQIHHDRLGRSLDRLLKELYTKDTHFVLELIQNADDNTYPDEMFTDDSDDRPTVAFIIKEDKVVVLNNETGFEERNIKAICDVGKSTKGEHRKGYIGKSTFVLNGFALSSFPAVLIPSGKLSYWIYTIKKK